MSSQRENTRTRQERTWHRKTNSRQNLVTPNLRKCLQQNKIYSFIFILGQRGITNSLRFPYQYKFSIYLNNKKTKPASSKYFKWVKHIFQSKFFSIGLTYYFSLSECLIYKIKFIKCQLNNFDVTSREYIWSWGFAFYKVYLHIYNQMDWKTFHIISGLSVKYQLD